MITQNEVPEEIILGEGGTGLLKIHSLLEYNIAAKAFTVYYVNGNKMNAEIIIEFSALEVSDENTDN